MKRVRLTRSGVGLLVGSIGLVVFALLLRYREIGLLGAIGLILVAVAATRPRPAPGIYLKRTLSRPMVQRGEPFELRQNSGTEAASSHPVSRSHRSSSDRA